MSVLPDPSTLRSIATRLGLHAEATRGRAVGLEHAIGAISWQGFAAGAFDVMVHPVTGGLRSSATDLDRAAASLRDLAGNLESVLADLSRAGIDVLTTGNDIVALLRDGTDPRTLLTHPSTLVHDGIRLGNDGANLVGDGVGLTGDVVDGVAGGIKDSVKSLGSLVGI